MLRYCTNRSFNRLFHSSTKFNAITPFKLADIGEGISEVEIIQWFVKPGDKVEEFSKICEVQSDKAAVEISSRYEGTVMKLYHETGAIAKVGSPLCDIDTPDTAESGSSDVEQVKEVIAQDPKSIEQEAKPTMAAEIGDDKLTFATPAVRRIAKEHKVDLKLVVPTGPKGRVLKGDILQYVEQVKNGTSPSVAVPSPTAQDKTVPLTAIQKAMFKSMTKSLSIPHFGFSDEVIVNRTSQLRNDVNAYLKTLPKGTYTFEKISYMPIFLKALSEALKEYPILNAKIIDADTTPALQFRHSHNIGIAMDTPQGLVVPNVKNVQDKSILDIAVELETLKGKGQKGGLTNQDLQGGTITLSNVGNIGGTALHPVLVTSEVCIGALGRVQRLPRFEKVDGIEKVVAKEILNVSFNADHRVIDGATVARFVKLWKTYLEHPTVLTASLK